MALSSGNNTGGGRGRRQSSGFTSRRNPHMYSVCSGPSSQWWRSDDITKKKVAKRFHIKKKNPLYMEQTLLGSTWEKNLR